MKQWIKLYTKIVDDPDLAPLPFDHIGVWALLLALAGKIDDRDEEEAETGKLDTPERIAWHLRRELEELQPAMAAFEEKGMLHSNEGTLYITNYGKRQARTPSARRQGQDQ